MDPRENLFQHFLSELPSTSGTPHPCHGIDAEELCDEPDYDKASESEEDMMSQNDDELMEEDDEDVSLTVLQPVNGSFMVPQASEGSATASRGREASINVNPDTSNGSLVVPNDDIIHGLSTAKDGTVWSKTAPTPARTSASNIFRPPPKQVVNSRSLFSVGQTFKRFINAKMVDRIVSCTNSEGERVRGDRWSKTDSIEIEAMIGCLLHMGALHNNESSTPIVWHKVDGNHMVQACFSRQRFLRLSNHLRFDDKETRSARRERDNFAPLREIWDDFIKNLGREYLPGPCLTVDEQLMPWRGRCSFLQYLPSKPDKYGIKIFWICDAENGYPLYGDPYLGRKGRPSAAREKNIGRNTAIRLTEPYFGTGRNLTTDNFFTDMVLASHLLKNGVTLVGTVRRDKRFLPHEFQKGTGMSKGDAMFGFTKTTTICAYKSNSKKHAVVLSTMHHSADNGIANKPEIVESYNATKGGVDSMDQMCHKFTTKRKTNRWPLLLFYNMLDLASIASIICWRKTFPEDTMSAKDMRAQFNIAIGRELVQPQLDRRRQVTNLSVYLRSIIDTALSVYSIAELPEGGQRENLHTQKKRGRCHICPRKKDTKTVHRCASCNNFVCNRHVKKQVICDKC